MRDVRSGLLPFLLILPAVAYFAIFFAVPLGGGIWIAFTDSRTGEWAGLANFEAMASSRLFQAAFLNTFLLAAVVIPIQLGLALVIALLVNSRMFGSGAFLYLAAIPIAISEIAAAIIFLSIFTGSGYLNSFLFGLGLIDRRVAFLGLGEPGWLFAAVALTEVWRATAIVMIILVAGLQAIQKDYLDAARVFGASRTQRLRFVVLPLLKPTIQTALIIRTVLALQLFAPILVLTGRLLPVLASETYEFYVNFRDVHVAAAFALVIMIVSALFVLFYLVALRTRWRP